MNADEPHTLDIPLDFLEKDRQYIAYIYSDDPSILTLRRTPYGGTHVKISRFIIDSSSVLKAELPPRGGQAVRIHSATAEDVKTYSRYENR